MNTEIQSLPIPNADGSPGAAIDVTTLSDATVYIHAPATGAASFSLLLQAKISSPNPLAVGSGDVNDDWIDLGSAITAPALIPLAVGGVPIRVTHLRVYRTTIGGTGTPPAAVYLGRR